MVWKAGHESMFLDRSHTGGLTDISLLEGLWLAKYRDEISVAFRGFLGKTCRASLPTTAVILTPESMFLLVESRTITAAWSIGAWEDGNKQELLRTPRLNLVE